jgi:SAM-dependent methyltransferase
VNPYFEARAKNYVKQSGRGLWQRFRQTEYSVVAEFLEGKAEMSLADLGCGAGFYATRLKKEFGLHVVGIDSSPGMLRHLENSGIRTILSTIETMPIEEKFDLALIAGVLEFISRPDLVFKKCAEILKPGGRLVTLIPNDGVLGSLYRRFHEFQDCPTYLRSREQYQAMAKLKGFTLVDSKSCTPISQVVAFAMPNTADR